MIMAKESSMKIFIKTLFLLVISLTTTRAFAGMPDYYEFTGGFSWFEIFIFIAGILIWIVKR